MGFAQVFVSKMFVHRLQTTKILTLENYLLYGSQIAKKTVGIVKQLKKQSNSQKVFK